MAMINYYGGQMSNELTNEKCTHVISINYDDQSNQLEKNESNTRCIQPIKEEPALSHNY